MLLAADSLGAAADVGFVHVAAAVRLGLEGAVGARAQLKGGVQLRVDYDAVVIERADAPTGDDLPLLPEGAEIAVAVPGVTLINDDWSLRAALNPFDDSSLRLAVGEGSTVVLCGRRAGDRFAPLGLNGHSQKIGKWMIDHLVPRDVRDRLPLLLVDGEIAALWWRGWTVSEAFAVREQSARVVYFEFRRNSGVPPEKT
ncbi:MAG: tRNA lysidine(34) synthetase TilS [Anaerolineae bacterium]